MMEFSRNFLRTTKPFLNPIWRASHQSYRPSSFSARCLSQYNTPQLRSQLRTTTAKCLKLPYFGARSFTSTLPHLQTAEVRLPVRTPDKKEEFPRDAPAYEITFTCKPCLTRATHRISKQGYHKGTVLITCPNCKARHLISDHLKIFRDNPTTIEDILKEQGETMKKGGINNEGDIEWWDDSEATPKQ